MFYLHMQNRNVSILLGWYYGSYQKGDRYAQNANIYDVNVHTVTLSRYVQVQD